MQAKNIYYQDLIVGKVLRPLIIQEVVKEGFTNYMKSIGKLGGQNKVPRVADNRKIADVLEAYLVKK
jgi:phage-related tail protein